MIKLKEEEIINKAVELAPILMLAALEFQRALITEFNKAGHALDEDKELISIYESLFFIMHIKEREAFEEFNSNQRSIFIDTLYSNIGKKLKDFQIKEEEIMAIFNYRHEHYAQCVWENTDPDKGHRGELLWEFGKNVAKQIDMEKDPYIIGIIMAAMSATLRHFVPKLSIVQ